MKSVVLTAALLLAGCSGSEYRYVEIAPDKYVPVKFDRRNLEVKYNNEIVSYMAPVRTEPPMSLMEYNGKLYLLAFYQCVSYHPEVMARNGGPPRWRCFEQDGPGFKEIATADYPRSIATLNIWRPKGFQNYISSRYRLGNNHNTIDQLILARDYNTEDLYFPDSEVGWLWYMLTVTNDFRAIDGTGPVGMPRYAPEGVHSNLVHEFKAKYKPVRLKTMELTPVPRSECDFGKQSANAVNAASVLDRVMKHAAALLRARSGKRGGRARRHSQKRLR